MVFNISWGSCENRFNPAYAGYHIVNQLHSVAFWRLDDMPYCNQGFTCWGTTTTGVTKTSTVADFQAIYDQSAANPGMVYIDANVPNRFRVAGDHGRGGNDWDHTYETSEADSPIGTTNDLAGEIERNTHWERSMTAFLANALDNPALSLPAEVPSGASREGSTPNSEFYRPGYFKVGFDRNGNRNDVSPLVECFTLDCITSRDPISSAVRTAMGILDADAMMIGPLQEAQLIADHAASAAVCKVVFSAKKFFANAVTDNGDIWAAAGGNPGFETQRDRILNAFDAAGGTTVIVSGDRHVACVDVKLKSAGDSWDIVNVTAGTWNKPAVAGSPDGVQTRFMISNTTTPANVWVFGNLEFHDDFVEIQLRNSLSGKKLDFVRVNYGESKLSYDSPKAAI